MIQHKLPQNLKRLRNSKLLYQKGLVEQIGKTIGYHIPQTSYSNYERGTCEPHISALKALADFHEVSMDDICYFDFDNLDFDQIQEFKNNYKNKTLCQNS